MNVVLENFPVPFPIEPDPSLPVSARFQESPMDREGRVLQCPAHDWNEVSGLLMWQSWFDSM